jgi:hypothetical protein
VISNIEFCHKSGGLGSFFDIHQLLNLALFVPPCTFNRSVYLFPSTQTCRYRGRPVFVQPSSNLEDRFIEPQQHKAQISTANLSSSESCAERETVRTACPHAIFDQRHLLGTCKLRTRHGFAAGTIKRGTLNDIVNLIDGLDRDQMLFTPSNVCMH